MAAATAPRETQRKESDRVAYKMGAVKIYKGTMVSLRNDGYAYPARSGTNTDVFIGVAEATVDNSAGAAGDLTIRVDKTGTHVFNKATAAITDLGVSFYASDDQTLTTTALNNQFVGVAVDVASSSTLRLRIDTAVK